MSGNAAYPSRRFWTWERDNSKGWAGSIRLGRLQLQLTVIRHSGHLPDRWVLQPEVIYDRAR